MSVTPWRVTGAILLCLLPWQISCTSKPVAVRTETVEVQTPVLVKVDPALTKVDPEPRPPGRHCTDRGKPTVCNGDLVDSFDAWRAWGRGLARRLQEIAKAHGESAGGAGR